MEIQKIIQAKIDSCELCGEDPDSASWGYQEGVLISCNQAKQLLQLLSKAPEMLEMLQRLITALDEGELSYDTTEILTGLKICKEMWAQGTISHETISENEKYYSEQLESQTCGLLPSELLKQRDEMRDMLKEISECLQNGDAFPVYKIEILLESTEVKPLTPNNYE